MCSHILCKQQRHGEEKRKGVNLKGTKWRACIRWRRCVPRLLNVVQYSHLCFKVWRKSAVKQPCKGKACWLTSAENLPRAQKQTISFSRKTEDFCRRPACPKKGLLCKLLRWTAKTEHLRSGEKQTGNRNMKVLLWHGWKESKAQQEEKTEKSKSRTIIRDSTDIITPKELLGKVVSSAE